MIVYMYLIRESFHGLLHLNMKLILKYINIMISSLTNLLIFYFKTKNGQEIPALEANQVKNGVNHNNRQQ